MRCWHANDRQLRKIGFGFWYFGGILNQNLKNNKLPKLVEVFSNNFLDASSTLAISTVSLRFRSAQHKKRFV